MRRRISSVAFLALCALPDAYAAFGGFMPLAHSGQVSYNYGYAENAGSQSESTRLLFGWNASGFIWRPWFASTSMALNVGLSSAQSTTTSSEGTVGTGSFSIGVFPRSRFPFAMTYSRTDSRSEQFQDLSQVTGSTSYRVTRFTLRQSYRPRAYNQLYIARYNSTKFDGDSFGSDSVNYGLDYQLRVSKQTFTVNTHHSSTRVSGVPGESVANVVSLNHVYTPSAELGVNSLVSYVEVDPGNLSVTSADSQAFSSFFWRPEHRAVSVSGGVRLSETKTEGASETTTRSLNTNLGLSYRITRALNFGASAAIGTSDNETAQSLSTSQTANLRYAGKNYQWGGYSYSWGWGTGASNSTVKTETGSDSTSSDRQNYTASIGHNLGKSWPVSRSSSMSATFSQSASGSKSTDSDVSNKTLSHGANLSWSLRGGRGSSYVSARVNDSRNYGKKDSVFDAVGLAYNADVAFNRLSSMSGNASFNASRNEAEDDAGTKIVSSTKNVVGSMSYRHSRPFGIYNLKFTASVAGSKQLDSPSSSRTLRGESSFSYALGLLSTSLNFRVSESAGGTLAKSMNFQATRSF